MASVQRQCTNQICKLSMSKTPTILMLSTWSTFAAFFSLKITLLGDLLRPNLSRLHSLPKHWNTQFRPTQADSVVSLFSRTILPELQHRIHPLSQYLTTFRLTVWQVCKPLQPPSRQVHWTLILQVLSRYFHQLLASSSTLRHLN